MTGAPAGLALGTLLYAWTARRLPRPRVPTRREGRMLAAASVSGAAEELLWRGPLLRLLVRRGRPLALAVTSLGFAASHLPRADRRALAAYSLLGSALGLVAARPRGLMTAAVAHATYDVLVLLEEPPP